MLGHPKYELGQEVKFTHFGEEKIGKIFIIDAYGSWDVPTEVSYDIWVDEGEKGCLYKHFAESVVSPL